MGRTRRSFDSLRRLEKEGLIPRGTFERARTKIVAKQRQLELTEKNNFETARKFAKAFRRSDGTWASDQSKDLFAGQMARLGKLRDKINFLRQSRGLKPKRFKDNPYA